MIKISLAYNNANETDDKNKDKVLSIYTVE